jgi:phospholipase/carboxylesterase
MAVELSGAEAGRAVLRARPGSRPAGPAPAPGTHLLGVETGRDGLLYVPREMLEPAPLLVLFHGAGGRAPDLPPHFADAAEARGILLLAPESRGRTWDVIEAGGYGADVAFLDRALEAAFAAFPVDGERVGICGFSDGASYALSLGLSNGDLFRQVLALSPGFSAPSRREGRPRVFVSHGVRDQVLPIDPCSRRIVRVLRGAGYDVEYREFDGGHVLPPEMVTAAVARFLA